MAGSRRTTRDPLVDDAEVHPGSHLGVPAPHALQSGHESRVVLDRGDQGIVRGAPVFGKAELDSAFPRVQRQLPIAQHREHGDVLVGHADTTIAVVIGPAVEGERRLEQRTGALELAGAHMQMRAQRARRVPGPDATTVGAFLQSPFDERLGICSGGTTTGTSVSTSVLPTFWGLARTALRARLTAAA